MTANPPAPAEMCLVLVRRQSPTSTQVLLGEKLRGFGRGRVVAPGGKIDAGESPAQAASRELSEETGLTLSPSELEYCALLDFSFAQDYEVAEASPPLRAHVFTARRHSGQPADSDEITVRWVNEDSIPYPQMWADAYVWMPRVLRNERPHLTFRYGPEGTRLEEIEDLGQCPPHPPRRGS